MLTAAVHRALPKQVRRAAAATGPGAAATRPAAPQALPKPPQPHMPSSRPARTSKDVSVNHIACMTIDMRQQAPSARSHGPSERHSKITPHTLLRWNHARPNTAPALSRLGGAAFTLPQRPTPASDSGHLPGDTPRLEYIPEPGVVSAVHDQQRQIERIRKLCGPSTFRPGQCGHRLHASQRQAVGKPV